MIRRFSPIVAVAALSIGTLSFALPASANLVVVLNSRDASVTLLDRDTGAEKSVIPVGKEPHGLTVWPQPGRYSLGHTGNMR